MAPGLKKNYRCVPSLQPFYDGGPFAVASDGSFIACVCGDEVKIVNTADASLRGTVSGDSQAVTALALSPDDRLLFSASHSRLIRVWDLSSLRCIRSWKGHDGPVMAMACHASGGLLATAGSDRKVCVWDVDGGFCTHFFKGHKGVVSCIMFHHDPLRLLLFSGSDDGSVRVWNLETKRCVGVLEKHFSAVTSLAMCSLKGVLLSSGRDKVVNVWDVHDFSFKMTVPTYEIVEAACVIQPDSNFFNCLGIDERSKRAQKSTASLATYFLTVGERGIVRIWSTMGSACLFEQQSSDVTITSDDEGSRRGFLSAILLPKDQGLLCCTADQQFLFYRAEKSTEGNLLMTLYKRLVGNNEEILDMKFIGDDENYLAVATNLEQVRVYDLASMSCAYTLAGHTEIVVCLDTCVSSSGKMLLLTGSKDKTVRLWDLEARHSIAIGQGHAAAVGAVAFSKKSKNFFVSGSSDRTIKLWSFGDDTEGSEDEIVLKTKAVVAAHDKDINSLAISPNDSLVCSGSEDRTACIRKLPSLTPHAVLKGHKRGVWSVEFSPVEQCVLTSSGDRTIKIWAVSDGSCLKTFEGHTSSVLRASFLSRGTQFVSSGSDGLVKLWTIKSNECIATYDQHEGKIWAMAISKRMEMLATGGTDAVVNLWHDCTSDDKEEAFRQHEEAVLKDQELNNAVSDSNYTKAIQLAFELRKPHRLFDLFSTLCRRGEAEDPIIKGLGGLGKEELRVLFEYIREWNTKPKLCHVGQFVLSRILKIFPPTQIMEIKGISEILEGLIPYSRRHLSRVDRLVRSTYLLDYTLTRMSVLDPKVDTAQTQPMLSISKVDEDATVMGSLSPDQKGELPKRKRKGSKSGRGLEKKCKTTLSLVSVKS